MNEILLMRGFERLLIIAGGIFFGYLGYRLFLFGVEKGTAKMSAETKFYRIVFSGTAPGLFFMLCGCVILLTGVFNQARSKNESFTKTGVSTNGIGPSEKYEFTCQLECSGDLTNWMPITTTQTTNSKYNFFDSSETNSRHPFYRFVIQ
jgi:hypothetical protein